MPILAAALVHLLTATGAVLALLALLAAADAHWHLMFLWLGAALIVDAVDGPLARWLKIETLLPRFSGRRLDMIVDYATYVGVPAFALAQSHLLPEWSRIPAAAAVVLSSLFHFADRDSKTKEGYFVGFPALWNVVCLYLFVLGLPPAIALFGVCMLVILTFVPLLWLHPLRVSRLRSLTLSMTAAWGAAALGALAHPFPSPPLVQAILVLTGLCVVALGASRGLRKA